MCHFIFLGAVLFCILTRLGAAWDLTNYFRLELRAGACPEPFAFTQNTLRTPLRQDLSLTLGPTVAAFDPSQAEMLSQQDMVPEPQETQSLLAPLAVCSQGPSPFPLSWEFRGVWHSGCACPGWDARTHSKLLEDASCHCIPRIIMALGT